MLGHLLIDQLEFYWDAHLSPRLAGLTDEEYLWEPAPSCWSIRRDAVGEWRVDWAEPEPQPAPFTTIAWRLIHIARNMGIRTNAFFPQGRDVRDEPGPTMFDEEVLPKQVPATAAEGRAFVEHEYRRWHDAVSALDDEAVLRPLGPRGAYFADHSMAALILHVSREVMHHGGEVGVLRDLYRSSAPPAAS